MTQAFQAILAWTWCAANSNFGTALLGAGAGAVAGAWAAQRIAARSETRRSQIDQIHGVNVAINIAVGIGNAFAGLKRQYVRQMQEELKRLTEAHTRYEAEFAAGKDDLRPFVFDADMKAILPMPTLIDELKVVLFQRLDPNAEALSLYQHLSTAIANSNDILRQRNEVLEEIRNLPPQNANFMIEIYLGLPRPHGGVDARHPTLVEAIALQTDDIIVFSKVLAESLMDQGRGLAKEFGKGAPKVARASFERLDELGLLPDMKAYEELLRALRGKPPNVTTGNGAAA